MNSFLYTNPNISPLDGILPKHLPHYIDRLHTMDTDSRGDDKDAQDTKPSKAYAWKRRRKKTPQLQGAELPPQAGTTEPLPLDCQKCPLLEVRYCRPGAGPTALEPVLLVHSGLRAESGNIPLYLIHPLTPSWLDYIKGLLPQI